MVNRLAADQQQALVATLQNDPSPEVRAEAAFSLALRSPGGDDGDDIAAALWHVVEDGPDVPRRAAVLALGYRLDEEIARGLVRLLVQSPELWREVSIALAGLRSPAIEAELQEILETAAEARSRRGAARALGLTAMSAAAARQLPGLARWAPRQGGQAGAEVVEDHPFFGYEDSSCVRHPLI
jgi:HEAT repeat protein